MRVLPAILLTVLAGGACAPQAIAADTTRGRELLEQFVSRVTTMSGRFEQQLVDENDIVVETSTGSVHIHRPGRFRWTYVEPYEQVLVADGLNVWSYDVDLAQVTVKPQAQVLASTPAALLGGAADVLNDFEFLESLSDRGTEWVMLRRDVDSGFSQVDLGFTDGTLTRMIFRDNLEQSTLIALHDLAVNEDIDDSLFIFSPPADADLVGEPLLAEAVATPAETDQ